MTASTVTQEVMIATKEDISRLEASVKELTSQIQQIIVLGERQNNQGVRIGNVETEVGKLYTRIDELKSALNDKHDKLDRKVADWISRGVGAWFVLVIAAGVINFFSKH